MLHKRVRIAAFSLLTFFVGSIVASPATADIHEHQSLPHPPTAISISQVATDDDFVFLTSEGWFSWGQDSALHVYDINNTIIDYRTTLNIAPGTELQASGRSFYWIESGKVKERSTTDGDSWPVTGLIPGPTDPIQVVSRFDLEGGFLFAYGSDKIGIYQHSKSGQWTHIESIEDPSLDSIVNPEIAVDNQRIAVGSFNGSGFGGTVALFETGGDGDWNTTHSISLSELADNEIFQRTLDIKGDNVAVISNKALYVITVSSSKWTCQRIPGIPNDIGIAETTFNNAFVEFHGDDLLIAAPYFGYSSRLQGGIERFSWNGSAYHRSGRFTESSQHSDFQVGTAMAIHPNFIIATAPYWQSHQHAPLSGRLLVFDHSHSGADCNSDGEYDASEFGYGQHDCNGNHVPDECDISNGYSEDYDGDGYPDSCYVRGLFIDKSFRYARAVRNPHNFMSGRHIRRYSSTRLIDDSTVVASVSSILQSETSYHSGPDNIHLNGTGSAHSFGGVGYFYGSSANQYHQLVFHVNEPIAISVNARFAAVSDLQYKSGSFTLSKESDRDQKPDILAELYFTWDDGDEVLLEEAVVKLVPNQIYTLVFSSTCGGMGDSEIVTTEHSLTIDILTVPGDLTDDQTVDVRDLLQLLLHWGACEKGSDCPADFNADGVVDVQDLTQLLIYMQITG